jgi:hypothetical protein
VAAKATEQDFIDAGFDPWVAEGLAEQEVTLEAALTQMSDEDVLDKVFEYHGFIGFTSCIVEAVDNVRRVVGDD